MFVKSKSTPCTILLVPQQLPRIVGLFHGEEIQEGDQRRQPAGNAWRFGEGVRVADQFALVRLLPICDSERAQGPLAAAQSMQTSESCALFLVRR